MRQTIFSHGCGGRHDHEGRLVLESTATAISTFTGPGMVQAVTSVPTCTMVQERFPNQKRWLLANTPSDTRTS